MRLTGLALLVLLAPWSSSALAEKETSTPPVQPETQEIGLLFTQNATSGSLRALEGKDSDRYVLTLNNPGRQVIWFQDRPGRQSGHLPIRDFIEAWDGFGFADDPPNAALSVLDGADHQDTAILTLGTPRYKDAKRKLRYPVRAESEATGNLAHFEHDHDPGAVERFGHAALFIDDATARVVEGCLIAPSSYCRGVNLQGEDLSGLNLRYVKWQLADLFSANLSGADLTLADLQLSYLGWADLTKATLRSTSLNGADLFNADLTGADLERADLRNANLNGANLSNARLCQTRMPDGSTNNRDC